MKTQFLTYFAAVLGLSAVSYDASGGLGVGSSFVHRENRAFDFHIAYPKYWQFSNDRISESVTSWELTNLGTAPAGSESSIAIIFSSAFQVADAEELLAVIKSEENSDIEWTRLTQPFVGWTSGDLVSGGNWTHSIEYYLSEKNLVIRLESIVRPEGSGAQDVINIVSSIERASAPPRITAVETEGQRVYRVGEEACFKIEVDDLKSSFDSQGLDAVEFRGQKPYWRFRRTRWVPEKNWFEVCVDILPSFKHDGLVLDLFSMRNNRGQVAFCQRLRDDSKLLCDNLDGTDPHDVPVTFPRVANPKPDLFGPEVHDVSFDENRLEIIVDASDPSGILGGRVITGVTVADFETLSARSMSWFLFPEHLVSRKPLSVATKLYRGWITIKSILVFDRNGTPTVLRQPNGKCQNLPGADPHYYESVQETGECQRTTIPVITFINK